MNWASSLHSANAEAAARGRSVSCLRRPEPWALYLTLKAKTLVVLWLLYPDDFGLCFQTLSCPLTILFMKEIELSAPWRRYN